jgi:alkanesulfonate monooxygenase SsuD/methylene tetrahydromethanopterin reductase-like flavin-dependent oxidoreductase (luciferase family)
MEVSCHLLGYGWTYDQVISGWQEIEELGFDACYAPDDISVHHMDAVPHSDVGENVFETWTILSAVAGETKRMRIGSLVSPCGRRHPVMLAKMTSAVDVISGGRLTLGMGTGNSPDQYHSMGIPFPGPVERTAMLGEELHIIRSLWTQARTTFRGRYYTIENAVNSPKPVQQPHPEILVALKSRRYVPSIAAEYADRVNILGADDSGVMATVHAFEEACMERGRDSDKIIKSRIACVVFTDGEVERKDTRMAIRERAIEIGFDPDELVEDLEKYLLPYGGPASGCAEALKKRTADLGFQEIVIVIDVWGLNSYERTMSGFRTFAREVMPQLRDC